MSGSTCFCYGRDSGRHNEDCVAALRARNDALVAALREALALADHFACGGKPVNAALRVDHLRALLSATAEGRATDA